jgi:hypothetical protein
MEFSNIHLKLVLVAVSIKTRLLSTLWSPLAPSYSSLKSHLYSWHVAKSSASSFAGVPCMPWRPLSINTIRNKPTPALPFFPVFLFPPIIMSDIHYQSLDLQNAAEKQAKNAKRSKLIVSFEFEPLIFCLFLNLSKDYWFHRWSNRAHCHWRDGWGCRLQK